MRSSTTQLAVVCKSLHAHFRWMVSGTPLHAGVDDLNGELAFLGVWPFCLSDQTDGFWAGLGFVFSGYVSFFYKRSSRPKALTW